jgi:hypothetical protein
MPTLNTSLSATVNVPPRVRSRIGPGGALLGLATAVLALSGCAQPEASTVSADEAEVQGSELTDADGRPCPKDLPIGEDPSGHGFGVEDAADEPPTIAEPQDAWVCRYDPSDVGTTSSGGALFEWRRVGQPEAVPAADLPDLHAAVDDLAVFDGARACTSDLGPRWMIVYSRDGDLTGVVVDGYGCREVRLTDNPHTTPPGAENQDGTVGGVLDGGAAILEAVGIGRSR